MNELMRTPRGDLAVARRALMSALVDDDGRPVAWLSSTLLRPGQVAALMQVSRRSVSQWAGNGLLQSIRTPGGHRRFRASDVFSLIDSLVVEARRAPTGA